MLIQIQSAVNTPSNKCWPLCMSSAWVGRATESGFEIEMRVCNQKRSHGVWMNRYFIKHDDTLKQRIWPSFLVTPTSRSTRPNPISSVMSDIRRWTSCGTTLRPSTVGPNVVKNLTPTTFQHCSSWALCIEQPISLILLYYNLRGWSICVKPKPV